MKKFILIILIICTFIIVATLLSGCGSSASDKKYREESINCVNDNEDALLELYGLFESNKITWISKIENDENTENTENLDGMIFEYNTNKYSIGVPYNVEPDQSSTEYLRACEIVDNLISNYSIDNIRYYGDLNYLVFTFNTNYIDAEYSILYYPPFTTPEEDVPDKEHTEIIRNGFYYYIYFKGF